MGFKMLALLFSMTFAGCAMAASDQTAAPDQFDTDYSVTLPSETSLTTWQSGENFTPGIAGNSFDLSGRPRSPITLKFETGDVVVLHKDRLEINGKAFTPKPGSTVVLQRKDDKVIVLP